MAARPPSISPARSVAFEVLQRVFEDGAYADRAFRAAAASLDERDRALAQRLAFGAVQRARTLDFAIEKLGRRPVRRLDPPVRAALRLGAYQLAFVDGVARYAAVNESVELVRRSRLSAQFPSRTPSCAELRTAWALVDELPDATATEAAVKHSYPDWIGETWWRDLGADGAVALMRASNEPGRPVVRLVRGEIEGTPDPDVPGAWNVERVDEVALAEGRIWPQSAASQLVGHAVGLERATASSTSVPRRAGRRPCSPVRSRRSRSTRARARARGERTEARGLERPRRRGGRPCSPRRPHRVRPRTRGRTVLRASES